VPELIHVPVVTQVAQSTIERHAHLRGATQHLGCRRPASFDLPRRSAPCADPSTLHRPLPDCFRIGFGLRDVRAVADRHEALAEAAVRTTAVEDFRPGEAYVTFRCWDPDGTEVEVFGEAP
jgi:hypothetical protein